MCTADWVLLPGALVQFEFTYSAPMVKLFWQIAIETNNAYFTVERVTDATTFKALGKQSRVGNSWVN